MLQTMIESRIIKENKTEHNILNLKSNVEKKLEEFERYPRTFETETMIVEYVGQIIDKTINHHINNGDINQRFEKDFRKFLATIINIDIN